MSLTTNDIALIRSQVAPVLVDTWTETLDATPVTVWEYNMEAAEVSQIEVVCTAMKDTSAAFVSRMAKTFFYDGVTLHIGGWWGYITKEYLGTGLSTCDFDFSVAGNTVSVVWTGEAAADIHANFKISLFDVRNSNPV